MQRGCDGIDRGVVRVTLLGDLFRSCPKRWLAKQAPLHDLVRDVQMFREHRLAPNDGGSLQQPARWHDALPIVEAELDRVRENQRAREAAKDGK